MPFENLKDYQYVGAGGELSAAEETFLSALVTGAQVIDSAKAIDVTIADGNDDIGMIITQNNTTHNPNALNIVNTGSGVSLYFNHQGSGAVIQIGVGGLIKRFHDTITLDTGDAESAVGLTPNGILLSAAIRVSTQITGIDSADHHIQLGINGTSNKYIDKAQGAAQVTIDVNKKDKWIYNGGTAETSALVLTITGGADSIPTAGAVEVEVVYLTSDNLADV